jgi:Leucine-rich repeat (LRR) protein
MGKRPVVILFFLVSLLFIGMNPNVWAQVIEQDSLALVALYNSTDGVNWTDKSNWLTGHVSSWYGITTDAGRVTKIELQNNNLEGAIVPELGNLTSLTSLYLHNNKLNGSIPYQLGNLLYLTRLYLSNNQLTGSIPPELGNLTNLTIIVISGNQLNGSIPFQLGDMANLQMLFFNDNQLNGSIPPELGNLSNLSDLYFSNNQLTGSIPTQLGDLENLCQLRLNNNQLDGSIPPELSDLAQLTVLDLSQNQLTGSIPYQLSYLEHLKTLALNNNQLEGSIPPELGNLLTLKTFSLGDNQLTGSIPSQLGSLTNLLVLNLKQNQLTDSIPAELMNLSKLIVLKLNDNLFPGSIQAGIIDLINLTSLYIQNNSFTDLPDLSPIPNLTTLYMYDNRFTFEDIEPNLWIPDMIYTPQDSVGAEQNKTVYVGSSLTLSVEAGGANNVYQWYKNSTPISGAVTGNYLIDPITVADSGSYHCRILNTVATQLSLYSRPIHVTVETIMDQDSLALVALYNSTDGTNWTDHTNWFSGPVETWYGIDVEEGRVTSISLTKNNLNGPIPVEIGDLDSLEFLYLNQNILSDTIPSEISNLTNMLVLSLQSNDLTGSIPPELGLLTSLNNLILNSNQLDGPIPVQLGDLTDLTMLELGYNQLTGFIPGEIGNLAQLTILQVNNNNLVGTIPDTIFNLPDLKTLRLEKNSFEGAISDKITNLANLELIWLHNNLFTDLPDISSVISLTNLKIQNNQFTFEDIEPNIGIEGLVYTPQDSVGEEQDTTVSQGSSLVLSVSVGGTANQYQWTKNGVDISGANNSLYSINSASSSDEGAYSCKITNTIATELTLFSRSIYVTVTDETGIADYSISTPDIFKLFQNYPNPFNSITSIKYELPNDSRVVLKIYNMLSQEVTTLIDKDHKAGYYDIQWDTGSNPSGLYFYHFKADGSNSVRFAKVKKMLLLK